MIAYKALIVKAYRASRFIACPSSYPPDTPGPCTCFPAFLTDHDGSRYLMMGCQPMRALRKYSSQAEPEVLDALQAIADREGRQLQAVIGDAMRDYLARKQQQPPRRNVLEAFQKSLKERDELYRKLAK